MAKEKIIKYDTDGAAIVWHEIDPSTLKGEQLKLWQEYKAEYAAASKKREAFESALRKDAGLPKGRRLVVGYNFGKLSVTNLVDTPSGGASKKAVSLAEALKA